MVVELYNQKVNVSSGEAVTQDFVYAAQHCYQHIFSKQVLATAILWELDLHLFGGLVYIYTLLLILYE
jgi:hypothetical protein